MVVSHMKSSRRHSETIIFKQSWAGARSAGMYMYMSVYVYVYVYVHVYVCVYVYAYVYVYVYVCIYIYMCVCVCMYIYIYMCVCVSVRLYLKMLTYIYINIHTHLCVFGSGHVPVQNFERIEAAWKKNKFHNFKSSESPPLPDKEPLSKGAGISIQHHHQQWRSEC